MRYLSALVACLTSSGALAATPAPLPEARDGAWLQNGDATTVTAYVCAVTDLEKYFVERASALAKALSQGQRKKQHLDRKMVDGMIRSLPIVIPLMNTDFLTDSPSCDKAVILVHDYLQKYPEMLPKDADSIVEKALLDAYTKSDEP